MENELSTINTLPALAGQLSVAIQIDPEKLRQEVELHTTGIASRTMAAKALKITDDASNQFAVNVRNDFAEREKALTKIWKRIKDPLNEMRAEIIKLEHATVDAETANKTLVDGKITTYVLAQRKAKAEADARMAAAAQRDQNRIAREAADMMAMGYVKEAQQKQAEAAMTVAPVMPDPVGKVSGASIGDKWVGKVTDPIALMRAIVEGKVPLTFEVKGEQRPIMVVDQVVINELVRRQQNALNIPGITVTEGIKIGSRK